MNLLEVIKLSDKFYRSSWGDKTPITRQELGKLSKESLLAKDWVVAERPILLNIIEFDQACQRVDNIVYPIPDSTCHIEEYINLLKKELFK